MLEASRYNDHQLNSVSNGKIWVPLTPEEKELVKNDLMSAVKEHFQKMDNLKEKQAAAARKREEATRKIAEADRKIAEADRNIDEANRVQIEVLVTLFFRIFHNSKQPVPQNQIPSLFSTYLVDGSISFDKAKHGFKLNSTQNIIRYLQEHPHIKQCDLRAFKTEIGDISKLAIYLAQESCNVQALAINRNVSKDALDNLNGIKKVKQSFKVQFFD